MKTQIAISPLRVPQTKKKDFILNLNNYRNTHFRTLSTVKRRYTELMRDQLEAFDYVTQAELLFVVYPKTRRKFDLDNVGSVHAKFFQDSLVTHSVIPDDDCRYITKVSFQFGNVDKDHPRVEVVVTSPDKAKNVIY